MSIAILAFAVAMAVATFIENDYDTATAKALIYNTKWFEGLMLILVINFLGNIFKYRLYRKEKWAVFLFHIAFIVTLIGSFVTRYYGFEGVMEIREGRISSEIITDKTYIDIRVDNGKIMKTYSENVLFSQLGSNNYSLSANFGKSGTTQKPFKVELINYIPKVKEVFIADETADNYIHIVESSTGKRNDIYLKEGSVVSIKNILFSFNKEVAGAMNITVKDDVKSLKPILDGKYMEMQTREFTNIKKDSLTTLQIKKLYSFENLNFVIKDIKKGKIVKKSAPKNEQQMYPYDELTFRVISGNTEKNLTIEGRKGSILSPKLVSINGLNFRISYGAHIINTPFSIKLRDFELERYPGTSSPSSYASEVTVLDKDGNFDYRIYMNHVLDYKGYRFFQASFTEDEKGTVLSVNHDYWGTLITYIGYFLMGIGMFFTWFTNGSRFSQVSKKLKKMSKQKIAILLFFMSFTVFSQENHEHKETIDSRVDVTKFVVKKEHADKFGKLLVQGFDGRMKPVNTYALDVLRKVFKKDKYKGLTAEQVVLSAQLNPNLWSKEPIIKTYAVKLGSEITKELGAKDNHISLIQVYKNGVYNIGKRVEESFRLKKALRNEKDKELINLDERVNIWSGVLAGSVLRIYPKANEANNKWFHGFDDKAFVLQDTMVLKMHQFYLQSLAKGVATGDYNDADKFLNIISDYQKKIGKEVYVSQSKIELEVAYNKWNIFKKLVFYYMIIGFIFLILAFIDLFKPNTKKVNLLLKIFNGLSIIGILIHTIGMGMRWYITGHEPWSNGYEAVVFVALVTVLAGLFFSKNKSKFILAVTVLFASFLLAIAHGSMMSPEMTNLEPVLKSYWLMIHVAIITGSYGFLGLGALLGFIVLLLYILRNKENANRLNYTIKELTYVNELTLTTGLFFLSVGTFLGGVWANESWGRYWSWDPKEVWALISMMIYVFVLHMRLVPGLQSRFAFNFASIVAISSIIMTFFGVNYYLSGMHSYAKGDPVPIPTWIYGFVIFIAIFSFVSYRKFARFKKK